jgi:hypothetical protein
MSVRQRKKTVKVSAPTQVAGLSTPIILLCFAAFVLVYYWTPLFDRAASIQWDAVDVHYSSQKYFADSILSGHLPSWTPYIYSGFPFLADPQTGAWYPLNWPFFLLGVVPRSIGWELALQLLDRGRRSLPVCERVIQLTLDRRLLRGVLRIFGILYGP